MVQLKSFQQCIIEYKNQLKIGAIQEAYRGIMEYIMSLRTHFMKNYPEYIVSGNIYFGYMDMTYFAVIPETLKKRNLKIAIVFLHETFRFEAWLSGSNKKVLAHYWEVVKASGWDKYQLLPQGKGVDSIIDKVLVGDPDFGDLSALTQQIEEEALEFIRDIDDFLSKR